jgi:hypothetical protein
MIQGSLDLIANDKSDLIASLAEYRQAWADQV